MRTLVISEGNLIGSVIFVSSVVARLTDVINAKKMHVKYFIANLEF